MTIHGIHDNGAQYKGDDEWIDRKMESVYKDYVSMAMSGTNLLEVQYGVPPWFINQKILFNTSTIKPYHILS